MSETNPGWHDDPVNSGQQRYWDGNEWTQARSKPAATPQMRSGDPLGNPSSSPLQTPASPPVASGQSTSVTESVLPPREAAHTQLAGSAAASTGPFASWPRRAGALILDGLILGIPTMLLLVLAVIPLFGIGDNGENSGFAIGAFFAMIFLFLAVAFIGGILYYGLSMTRSGDRNGQTFGKQLLGIKVIETNGEQIGWRTVVIRELLLKNLVVGTISSVTGGIGYLVWFLWPLWDVEDRCPHDMAANTRVIDVN